MKIFLILGSLFGFLSVAFGAFAAHTLRERLDERMIAIFQTAVQYQFFHAIALVLVSQIQTAKGMPVATGWFFVAGIVLFCGSLYALSLTSIRSFGAITPVGGIAFLIGWGLLFWRSL